jgi:hypothetical protein
VNKLKNGNIAIGAPGSIERVKVEYPKIIEELDSLYYQQALSSDAIEYIRAKGIKSRLETNSLMEASMWGTLHNERKYWKW